MKGLTSEFDCYYRAGCSQKEHKFLEVIILTGHGSLDSAVECTKLGAYGYLPKPYELDALIKILKEAYEERLKKKFQVDHPAERKLNSPVRLDTPGKIN